MRKNLKRNLEYTDGTWKTILRVWTKTLDNTREKQAIGRNSWNFGLEAPAFRRGAPHCLVRVGVRWNESEYKNQDCWLWQPGKVWKQPCNPDMELVAVFTRRNPEDVILEIY